MISWSTPQSIKNREISILAIFEILISVGVYWWISLYFNTYFHILLSVCITPLLLLKSEESIKMSLDLYIKTRKFYFNRNKSYIGILIFYFSALPGLFISILLGTFIYEHILISFPIVLLIMEIIAMSAIAYLLVVLSFRDKMYIIILLFMFSTVVYIESEINIILFLTLLIFGIFFSMGFILIGHALVAKILATLINIRYGYRQISNNWRYSNFIVDLKAIPEVIPGIEEYQTDNDVLKISYLKKRIKSSKNYFEDYYILIILTFAPKP